MPRSLDQRNSPSKCWWTRRNRESPAHAPGSRVHGPDRQGGGSELASADRPPIAINLRVPGQPPLACRGSRSDDLAGASSQCAGHARECGHTAHESAAAQGVRGSRTRVAAPRAKSANVDRVVGDVGCPTQRACASRALAAKVPALTPTTASGGSSRQLTRSGRAAAPRPRAPRRSEQTP